MSRSYPLSWPPNEPRTPAEKKRRTSQFRVTPDRALRDLYHELHTFKAMDVILSTNVPVKKDGMIYQSYSGNVQDPAVALYFNLGIRKISICCDLYMNVNDNIRAVSEIVKAMRRIERFGGQHLSDKSFTGFAALPPPKDCWQLLGVNKQMAEGLSQKLRREYIMEAFRDRAKEGHGAGRDMAELTEARDEALKQVGAKE